MMILGYRQRGLPAPYALPAGFAAFLVVGTVAAALHGRLDATGVLIACAAVAGAMSFVAEPIASVPLAGIGWLTVARSSRRGVGGYAPRLPPPRLGFPLVRPTAHTGKHGYVYGYARPPLCRQGRL